ncbi:MAG: 4-hydroxy-tetrahydrodipicolinate reductase [Lachnospiraceae bacterium]|nr:4-hydroxy-tetrahydrodipicolinate reductase [Lachnospiraceae bacterium]
MTKIIMHGCNGRMGQAITRLAQLDDSVEIVAGVDITIGQNTYPVYTDIEECKVAADVIIDFASAKAIDKLLDYVEATHIPVVVCTTGLSEEQKARLEEVSKKASVLVSANMSLGINVLFKVLTSISGLLSDAGFDIEIIEKHHNQKLDAPSGTALALADVINKAMENQFEYIYDRSDRRAKRDSKEIGISAVRGGTIVGDHEVIYAGEDEEIVIKHTAHSRNVFAKGALEAAKFLSSTQCGMYSMQDVVGK